MDYIGTVGLQQERSLPKVMRMPPTMSASLWQLTLERVAVWPGQSMTLGPLKQGICVPRERCFKDTHRSYRAPWEPSERAYARPSTSLSLSVYFSELTTRKGRPRSEPNPLSGKRSSLTRCLAKCGSGLDLGGSLGWTSEVAVGFKVPFDSLQTLQCRVPLAPCRILALTA